MKTRKQLQNAYDYMVRTQASYCRTRESCEECPFNDVFSRLFPKVKSSHITALVNAIRRCNNDFRVNDVQEILEYVERVNFNE